MITVFTSIGWMCFVINRSVKVVGRCLHETRTWQDILRRRDVLGEKQKLSAQAVNSSTSYTRLRRCFMVGTQNLVIAPVNGLRHRP